MCNTDFKQLGIGIMLRSIITALLIATAWSTPVVADMYCATALYSLEEAISELGATADRQLQYFSEPTLSSADVKVGVAGLASGVVLRLSGLSSAATSACVSTANPDLTIWRDDVLAHAAILEAKLRALDAIRQALP